MIMRFDEYARCLAAKTDTLSKTDERERVGILINL